MRTFTPLWTLPFVAALALPAQDQKPPDQAPAEAKIAADVARLQAELVEARTGGIRQIGVNGQTLSPEQVKREAIFLVGAKMVEAKISEYFIDEWMDRAIKQEGKNPADFQISEEKVVAELQATVKEFQLKNPGVEFWDAVRAVTGMDREGYLAQHRQTALFDKVFFPGAAKDWPMITREAIMASAVGGDGKAFWDNIEKSSTDENGQPRELPAFWMQLCRTWVQKQLKKWSSIKYPSDGLAADVVMSVNGREWHTNEAFEMVRPGLYYQDLERAISELVVREALKQELEKQGAWLNDEQFVQAFDDYRQEYDNTPFTTEVIAVAFKGYPSLEAFRQRWRVMKSFENLIAKDINDDNLKAHAEKFARFFSEGTTSADVIQFLAKDVKTGAWLPDGWTTAKQRAQAAFDEIESGKATFDEVLDQRGEFFQTDESKGRLGAKSLNQMRQSVRENEFTDLVLGYSLGNWLFYDAEEGKVAGPLRGSDAYYIVRVNSRTPARAPVSIADSGQRELVKQDYVMHRFLNWANGVLSNTKVE